MAAVSLDARRDLDRRVAGHGHVVVLAEDGGLGELMRDALEAAGWRVRSVRGSAGLPVGGDPAAPVPAAAVLQVRGGNAAGRDAVRRLRDAYRRDLPVLTVGDPIPIGANGPAVHLDLPFDLDDFLDTVRLLAAGPARPAVPVRRGAIALLWSAPPA